ncbi:MAG: SMI1/KNR4 family protein [Clostridia bacterium]|nr:SMI1/KNR4 family protein [Clostridia bacterium]
MFENIDLNDFWSAEAWGDRYHTLEPVTDELVKELEEKWGYKYPASYVCLMKQHNGGGLKRSCVKGTYSVIDGLWGIKGDDAEKRRWVFDDWGYPEIGIPISEGPSGHTMFFLDYRACGRDGEPAVAEIDQEADYAIDLLADSFEEFIGKLVTEDENDSEEVIQENYRRLRDPYRNVTLLEMDEKQRRELNRAIWGGISWGCVGVCAGILALPWFITAITGTQNAILLRVSTWALRLLGLFLLWVFLGGCLSAFFDMRKTYRCYPDRVNKAWEENGKKYCSLERSLKEKYENPGSLLAPGDEVTVFVPEKGTAYLVKNKP